MLEQQLKDLTDAINNLTSVIQQSPKAEKVEKPAKVEKTSKPAKTEKPAKEESLDDDVSLDDDEIEEKSAKVEKTSKPAKTEKPAKEESLDDDVSLDDDEEIEETYSDKILELAKKVITSGKADRNQIKEWTKKLGGESIKDLSDEKLKKLETKLNSL